MTSQRLVIDFENSSALYLNMAVAVIGRERPINTLQPSILQHCTSLHYIDGYINAEMTPCTGEAICFPIWASGLRVNEHDATSWDQN